MTTTQRLHNRALKTLLKWLCGGIAFIATLNYFIDPFAIYFDYPRPHVYSIRPAADRHVRMQKTMQIVRKKPDMLLFGSSTVNHGLDVNYPENRAVLGDTPMFNAGVSAGGIRESRLLLEHALANNPNVKWVGVALDSQRFSVGFGDGGAEKMERFLGRTSIPPFVYRDTLLTLDALKGSWEAAKIVGPTSIFIRDAKADDAPKPLMTVRGSPLGMDQIAFTEWHMLRWEKSKKEEMFEEEGYAEVQKIVDLCNAHGIKLHLFISPHFADFWQGYQALGMYDRIEEWKRRLVAIHPIWDFSMQENFFYNRNEKGEFVQYFWGDALHYTPATGAVMLEKMLHEQKDGVYVTPQNLEAHLKKNRALLAKWNRDNPDHLAALKLWKQPLGKDTPDSIPATMPKLIEENVGGMTIFLYMGDYYALPADQKPYDLLKLRRGEYRPQVKAGTLEEVRGQIAERN